MSKTTEWFTKSAPDPHSTSPDDAPIKQEPFPVTSLSTQDDIKTESIIKNTEIKVEIMEIEFDGNDRGGPSWDDKVGKVKSEVELHINDTLKSTPLFTTLAIKDDVIKEDPLSLKLLDKDVIKTELFAESEDIKEEVHFDDNVDRPLWDDDIIEVTTEDCEKNAKNDLDTESENEIEDCIKIPRFNGRIKEITLTKEQLLAEKELLKKDPVYLSRDYKCEYCVVSFVSSKTYKDHMRKHEVILDLPFCEICHSFLTTRFSLRMHYKRHFTRYECVICNKRFRNDVNCGSHYNAVHGSTHGMLLAYEFRCFDCDFVTANPYALGHHLREKTHKPTMQCNLCAKISSSRYTHMRHMTTVHGEETIYKCKDCDKTYTSKIALKNHVKMTHSVDKPVYVCNECKTVYKSRYALQWHLKYHGNHVKDDIRYECAYCGVKCLSKQSIRRHIYRLHMSTNSPASDLGGDTEKRPIKCQHCPEKLAHSSARYVHNKREHNPIRVWPPMKQYHNKRKSSKTGKGED